MSEHSAVGLTFCICPCFHFLCALFKKEEIYLNCWKIRIAHIARQLFIDYWYFIGRGHCSVCAWLKTACENGRVLESESMFRLIIRSVVCSALHYLNEIPNLKDVRFTYERLRWANIQNIENINYSIAILWLKICFGNRPNFERFIDENLFGTVTFFFLLRSSASAYACLREREERANAQFHTEFYLIHAN